MPAFYSSVNKSFSVGGTNILGINNDRIQKYYSNVTALPVTIRVHLQGDVNTLYMDSENAETWTARASGQSQDISPYFFERKEGSFRGKLRRYGLMKFNLIAGLTYIDITITEKTPSAITNPLIIHNIYALRARGEYPISTPEGGTFDVMDFSYSDRGRQEYEDLYYNLHEVESGNYAKRQIRCRAILQGESQIRNLYDIYNNYPEFVFEEDFGMYPERIYRAKFRGNIQEVFTYQYIPSGESLTFNIIQI